MGTNSQRSECVSLIYQLFISFCPQTHSPDRRTAGHMTDAVRQHFTHAADMLSPLLRLLMLHWKHSDWIQFKRTRPREFKCFNFCTKSVRSPGGAQTWCAQISLSHASLLSACRGQPSVQSAQVWRRPWRIYATETLLRDLKHKPKPEWIQDPNQSQSSTVREIQSTNDWNHERVYSSPSIHWPETFWLCVQRKQTRGVRSGPHKGLLWVDLACALLLTSSPEEHVKMCII